MNTRGDTAHLGAEAEAEIARRRLAIASVERELVETEAQLRAAVDEVEERIGQIAALQIAVIRKFHEVSKAALESASSRSRSSLRGGKGGGSPR